QRFDLITGEPPPPGLAGVETLYSREYFELIHDRLAEGGIVTYWLPLHAMSDLSSKAILRAFCEVFEDCSLWNGSGMDLILAGSRAVKGPVEEDQFTRQWRDPAVAAEMQRLGLERPEQLGALFIGDAAYLKGIYSDFPPLVDNYPRRIEPVLGSQAEVDRLLTSFTDVAAARERFLRSPLIARLWPERLRDASLPYFDDQGVINSNLYGDRLRPKPGMEEAHRLLLHSPLSTPVLWLLGSDSDIQRILTEAGPSELARPEMQYHLGLRLLADRRYMEAVEPLSRAEAVPEQRDQAFRLRVYALCMAGRTDQARQVAQARLARLITAKGLKVGVLTEADLPPFWAWIKKTFGIDPLPSHQPS
ncbi:MAG TPA: hypothetical protein VLY45_01040, partial [Nitrospiria bacterium]|nr:hypothetical protein [Nitrospiria bacterium]